MIGAIAFSVALISVKLMSSAGVISYGENSNTDNKHASIQVKTEGGWSYYEPTTLPTPILITNTPTPTAIVTSKAPTPTIKVVKPTQTTVKPSPTTQPTITPTTKPTTAPSCSSSFNSQMLTLINNHRVANGKGALTMNSLMNNAACGHSVWMSSTGTLSHTGANGSLPWDRCVAAGTSCDAENIAMNSVPSAQNLFNQWLNSPGHNANMLGDHTQIGIGLSGLYATTVFK